MFFLNLYYTFKTYDGRKSNEQQAKSNKQRATSEKFSLVYSTREIHKSADKCYQVKGVFLVISKAFDMIKYGT